MNDIRRLCSNGMTHRGYPECRPLVTALIDMGKSLEERVKFLYELYGEPLRPNAKEQK